MEAFLLEFSNNIKGMFLSIEKTDKIFELSIRLMEEFTQFSRSLMNDDRYDKNDAMRLALDFVLSKLSGESTSYNVTRN